MKNTFSILACFGVTTGICAQALEVVRLPKTTMEFVAKENGKLLAREEKTSIGTYGFPWFPETDPRRPPFGYKERRFKEVLTLEGKKFSTICIEWTPKRNGFRNYRSRKIAQWVAKDHGSPAVRFGLPGPDLTIYPGTVRFELLPDAVDPKSPNRRLAMLKGHCSGRKEITVLGKKHTAFRYSIESVQGQKSMRGETWLSTGVPGFIYESRSEITFGKRRAISTQRITKIELEPAPKGLRLNRAGMFATKFPKGWKAAKPKGPNEVLRLVPTKVENTGKTITVEVRPAKALDRVGWLAKLSPGFSVMQMGVGLGDVPASSAHRLKGSKVRARLEFRATVYTNKLYVLSYWQNQFDRGDSSSGLLDEIARSWRWLRIKKNGRCE